MWLYRRSEDRAGMYEVGFFDSDGYFIVIEWYNNSDAARRAVNYLNGGTGASE